MRRSESIMNSLVLMLSLVLVSSAVSAESAAGILEKVDRVGHTESTKMDLMQVVINPSGEKRSFRMMSWSQNGNEKGLTEYVYPSQVTGMKILTLNEGDDIWTYFPRTNRTRKIASSARNRRVQGSDFTYDDMASGKMAKQWKGKVAGSEKIKGKDCYRLEVKPTASGPKSYSKAVVWVGKSEYTVARVEYYDLDGDRSKRLNISDYRKISGVLVPMKYTMTNLLDGGKTVMKAENVKVNVKLEKGLFSEANLGR